VDCIYDGGDQFLINPEECIDCGACEPECPVEAIYPEDEVPEDMESYIAKNADFFE
jgi:NAD-dependent dihydropyrimidine dehydrogenase PreA subunit